MTQLQCHLLSARADRVRELLSIGAGHAAGALAQLLGATCVMDVPRVLALGAGSTAPGACEDALAFFEIRGSIRGSVAIRFPEAARRHLLDRLIGPSPPHEAADSALREVANILASHLVGAVGEVLGLELLPSVPVLVARDGAAALEIVAGMRRAYGGTVRVETDLIDTAGRFRIPVTFFPEEL